MEIKARLARNCVKYADTLENRAKLGLLLQIGRFARALPSLRLKLQCQRWVCTLQLEYRVQSVHKGVMPLC